MDGLNMNAGRVARKAHNALCFQTGEESVFQVYDNLGKQVLTRKVGKIYAGQELIDTRKLVDGLYLYQFVQNGKKVSDGKFIVTH